MKTLLILLTLISINVQAECTLDVKVKKSNSKIFYLSTGERITQSNIKKLNKVCDINITLMNERELSENKIKTLMAKLARAKKAFNKGGK